MRDILTIIMKSLYEECYRGQIAGNRRDENHRGSTARENLVTSSSARNTWWLNEYT